MFCRLFVFIVCLLFFFSCKKGETQLYLNHASGRAFGTTFSIQFFDTKELDYSPSYDSIVAVINNSMSTYMQMSDISKINKGDSTVKVDYHFKKVFAASKKIYDETDGAFDPTIGTLVNAWNFGSESGSIDMDSLIVDSLLITVGFDKIQLEKDKIKKKFQNTFLDFNALAKGYAVDVVADFLKEQKHENYLVEIGGEIRGKGKNIIKEQPWKIGIEDPNFDQSQSYSKIIELHDESMATSGSYRKFKVDDQGNRYAHIIDTKTGYPHQSNLLSVSVLAATCMEADAYATAFMSMGLEKSKTFLRSHPELKAYFIFENKERKLETLAINGFVN